MTTLFPLPHFIGPLRRSYNSRYLIFEVTNHTRKSRIVVIVAVMHYPDWQVGVPFLEAEINRRADAAFSRRAGGTVRGVAISKLYWIGAIGPHWQYGVKDEGQELKPLIAWHDTTHDKASCDDFKDLVALITDM